MKIVHEVNQLDFGGVEKIVRNIIKFDKKNEHSIAGYKDGEYRKELEDVGATIHILDPEGDINIAADIVHIHSGGAPSILAQDLQGEFPVIETIHSPVRSANVGGLVSVRVGVSEAVSKLNANCRTIKNGLDFEDMQPTKSIIEVKNELSLPIDVPVIGRLGRVGEDKGLEDWLLTCYELQQEGVNFVPLVVGGAARGKEDYIGKLKLLADSLPVKGVVWVGNQTEIANYLQIMNVFLYPSPTEGFGLVFCEAVHAGCMVVSYETEVTREIIGGYSVLTKKEDGVAGLVEGVKTAMNQGLKDDILGMQVSFVEDEYQAERMSKDYQDLYEETRKK